MVKMKSYLRRLLSFNKHYARAKLQLNSLTKHTDNKKPEQLVLVLDFTVIDFVTHHYNDLVVSAYKNKRGSNRYLIGKVGEIHFRLWCKCLNIT